MCKLCPELGASLVGSFDKMFGRGSQFQHTQNYVDFAMTAIRKGINDRKFVIYTSIGGEFFAIAKLAKAIKLLLKTFPFAPIRVNYTAFSPKKVAAAKLRFAKYSFVNCAYFDPIQAGPGLYLSGMPEDCPRYESIVDLRFMLQHLSRAHAYKLLTRLSMKDVSHIIITNRNLESNLYHEHQSACIHYNVIDYTKTPWNLGDPITHVRDIDVVETPTWTDVSYLCLYNASTIKKKLLPVISFIKAARDLPDGKYENYVNTIPWESSVPHVTSASRGMSTVAVSPAIVRKSNRRKPNGSLDTELVIQRSVSKFESIRLIPVT